MAKRKEPPQCVFRHFRKDGVTQFTEIPREPEVLDFLRDVFEEVGKLHAKKEGVRA